MKINAAQHRNRHQILAWRKWKCHRRWRLTNGHSALCGHISRILHQPPWPLSPYRRPRPKAARASKRNNTMHIISAQRHFRKWWWACGSHKRNHLIAMLEKALHNINQYHRKYHVKIMAYLWANVEHRVVPSGQRYSMLCHHKLGPVMRKRKRRTTRHVMS